MSWVKCMYVCMYISAYLNKAKCTDIATVGSTDDNLKTSEVERDIIVFESFFSDCWIWQFLLY